MYLCIYRTFLVQASSTMWYQGEPGNNCIFMTLHNFSPLKWLTEICYNSPQIFIYKFPSLFFFMFNAVSSSSATATTTAAVECHNGNFY